MIQLSDFNYHLPEELIAQEAVTPRSFSKLMVMRGKELEHRRFFNLPEYFQEGDVLVVNKSRVMKNKLVGNKTTGAVAEMIIMHAVDEDKVRARIKCSRVRVGNEFFFDGVGATVVGQENDIFIVQLSQPVNEIIDKFLYPNPPYIKRTVGEEYQTVYAQKPGSLAAPTAGLHFTPNLMQTIQAKGVKIATVFLHVGFGTFLPVRDEGVTNHKMEPEFYEIDQHNADIINGAKRLFIVGTTTLKALETSAQQTGRVQAKKEASELFIYPGHDFKLPVTGLITNFHLPKSTLILLVSALFGKETVLNAYHHAVEKRYRFFSLGDATLMLR